MNVEILFEDDDIIVVNKPAGMIVHPAPGHPDGTLVDALLAHCPQMRGVGSVERSGVVHRLDQETSGVMVFAKTDRAMHALRRDFEDHISVRKTYLAVLHGAPEPRAGTLETLIGRKPWDPKRMAVVERDGKRAVTHWTTLQRKGSLALVEFTIKTGRTHQIAPPPTRHLLHAVQLSFKHPITHRPLTFAAEPPEDIIYARSR